MADIFIGTDLVEVARIRSAIQETGDRFLNRIYTTTEQEYCKSKANPEIHYAGRFAGKEAVKKALLSSGVLDNISMKKIEIISTDNIPKVNIKELNHCVNLSISHVKQFATATAIIIIN